VSTLERVGDDLWIAQGPPVFFLGFRYPTRMAVVRLPDRGLWLWSPVALEPNALHHLALADWKKSWPELRLWAPPGLVKKRADLRFEGKLGDEAPAE